MGDGDGPDWLELTVQEANTIPTRALINLASADLIFVPERFSWPEGRPDPRSDDWLYHIAQVEAEARFLGDAVTSLLADEYFGGDENAARVWIRRVR
ncbi:MAG: hypothetical protein R2770_09225 [Acidimicrobiales bacterium]